MRRARCIFLFGVVIILLLAFARLVFEPREPSYNGKTLTEWLMKANEVEALNAEDYNTGDPEAIHAIRQIGTNALPTLLRFAAAKDSTFRRFLLDHQHDIPCVDLHLQPRSALNRLALCGFALLGADAKPAVPGLVLLLNDHEETVRFTAVYCLDYIGPAAKDAVPDLIKELEMEEKTSYLGPATFALNDIGLPENHNCVPVLIAALARASNYRKSYPTAAAEAALIKLHARPISPFIEQLKDSSHDGKWLYAARVIAYCGTNASPAISVLLPQLDQTNINNQTDAVELLGKIHQQPEICIPPLLPLLESRSEQVRRATAYVLRQFGKEAKPAVPALIRLLKDNDSFVRDQAAESLREIDSGGASRAVLK